jgi:hypothetical protein
MNERRKKVSKQKKGKEKRWEGRKKRSSVN